MPAPAWEDLGEFLDPQEFASHAVIRFQSGAQRAVVGIFDDPYLNAELGEYDMDNSRPRFLGKFIDFQGVKRGDILELDGQEYDILTSPQPDGTGMATLDLAEPRG